MSLKKQDQKSAKGRKKDSSSSPRRTHSPDPGSAIASLVFASSSNHVQHQVNLWNQGLKYEGKPEGGGGGGGGEGCKEEERRTSLDEELRREKSSEEKMSQEKDNQRIQSKGDEKRRMSEVSSLPSSASSSASSSKQRQKNLPSRSESLNVESSSSSTTVRSIIPTAAAADVVGNRNKQKEAEEQTQQEKGEEEEIASLDSSTTITSVTSVSPSSATSSVSSSSSSSSSARGTLSSPSVLSTKSGDNTLISGNKSTPKSGSNQESSSSSGNRSGSATTSQKSQSVVVKKKSDQQQKEMVKNPFKNKNKSSNNDCDVGQALAGVFTGVSTAQSVTSMDALDPNMAMGGPSVINPILAREARTRSFLVGNLGCHDGILGCEELTRFFPSGKVNIMLITWNMSGNHPPSELNDLLLPETLLYVPDIYAIAMQEMVFGEGKEIETQLQTTIGPSHVLLHSHIHGVLGLLIFVRRDLIWFFSLPEEAAYNVRPASMNMVKTKGAVGVSFSFFGTTFLFVNSHLPAHEARNKERKEAYEKIISSFDLPRNLKPLKPRYISSDVTARFDVCFWFGDLNFRVERGYEETIQILEEIKAQKELIKSGCVETGRIKRILGGGGAINRAKDSSSNLTSFGQQFGTKNNETNASNTSLQGSVSSMDSSGLVLEAAGGRAPPSPRLSRRISEPGTSSSHSGHRHSDPKSSSDTHSMENCYECLLKHDQLIRGMEDRQIFQGFQEVSEITFAPTFKYDIHGDNFDAEYHRVPSYTDRILARSKRPGHVTCLAYDSIPDIKTSDHKPVFALMECQIRPGKDTIPLNAGLFKRETYIEALRRRAEENFGSPAQASNCGVS